VQKQQFQPRAAYGACCVTGICAAALLFMDEYRIAAVIAAQAVFFFCLTYNAAKSAARKRTP
jgi:hypothetical protein